MTSRLDMFCSALSRTSPLRRGLLAATAVVAASLAGCASGPRYDFDHYTASLRRTAPGNGGYDPAEEIVKLEGAAEWAANSGRAMPPGFRSHLGWMHYNIAQYDRARALFLEEAALYPESAVLMELLVETVDAQIGEVDA